MPRSSRRGWPVHCLMRRSTCRRLRPQPETEARRARLRDQSAYTRTGEAASGRTCRQQGRQEFIHERHAGLVIGGLIHGPAQGHPRRVEHLAGGHDAVEEGARIQSGELAQGVGHEHQHHGVHGPRVAADHRPVEGAAEGDAVGQGSAGRVGGGRPVGVEHHRLAAGSTRPGSTSGRPESGCSASASARLHTAGVAADHGTQAGRQGGPGQPQGPSGPHRGTPPARRRASDRF
jgi:hypothetical protein